jgi:osmotically-inducible protein OsmY
MKRRTKTLVTSIVAFGMCAGVAIADSPGDPGMKTTPDAQQPADNSGRNVRDRNGSEPTAGQQSNDADDVKVTQAIRKAVVGDDTLSVNAHNVKIVTQAGVVTLRGPVKSEQEKSSIAKKAEAVPGVKRVDNQLEIAS